MITRHLIVAAAAILPLGGLQAATVVVPVSIAGIGSTALTPFDTSLGTLTSVSFDVSGSFIYGFRATAGTGSNNQLVVNYDISTLILISSLTSAGDQALFGNNLEMSSNVFEVLSPGETLMGFRNGGGGLSGSFGAGDLELFKAGIGQPRLEWQTLGPPRRSSSNVGIVSLSESVSDYALTGSFTYTYTPFPVTPPGGVIPEPASWALMIAGFGLVGAAARRRPALAHTHN